MDHLLHVSYASSTLSRAGRVAASVVAATATVDVSACHVDVDADVAAGADANSLSFFPE